MSDLATTRAGDSESSQPREDVPAAPVLDAGTRLGGYVLRHPLGQGGMGAVYEATQEALGRTVAVKVMHPAFASREVMRARFLREAQALARLKHPYVVDVIDSGAVDGVSFLVMEHLRGESLSECLSREGPLSWERACAVMLPVLAAVSAAHRAGIVHRDLKPQNVFLSRTPEGLEWPKVLDFGVARLLDDPAAGVTSTGATVGTAAYMSPEQLLGDADVGPHSDQFALAVLFFECVTGQRPFHANTHAALYLAMTRGAAPRASSLRAGLHPTADAALARALRPHAAERHPSVAAFARALLPGAPDGLRTHWEAVFAPDRDGAASLAPPTDPTATTRPAQPAVAPAAVAPSPPRTRKLAGALLLTLLATLCAGALMRASTRRTPAAATSPRVIAPPEAPPVRVETPPAAPPALPPALPPAPPPAAPHVAETSAPTPSAPRPARASRSRPRPNAARDAGAAWSVGTNEIPY